jgi:hypothetical protein
MATNPRLLFPHLPPELRNEVYKYISANDTTSPARNTGFPLQLKKYECKHTVVQLCPVHYGSNALLALQKYRFQEAREYRSWLLDNATELRIGVVFKGRINTFVQKDWDKKIEMHLQKLAKQHPWMRKVAKYDIQILWDSPDGVLKSKNNKRTAGQIPQAMVNTLVGLMDENVKGRNGHVTTTLRLQHHIAVGCAYSWPRFGLVDFFSYSDGLHGLRRQTRRVWKEPCVKKTPVDVCPGFESAPPKAEEKLLLSAERGLVTWADASDSRLVTSKDIEAGTEPEIAVGRLGIRGDDNAKFVFRELVEECLGSR